MSYSLVVSDISTTTEEDDIKRELIERYNGVKNVTRWYFDSDDDYPMSCVQVDFDSLENMNKVLNNGNIVISGICRRVSIVSHCYRCQQTGHKTYECDRPRLDEKDLINLFASQKKRLLQVMNNIEVKLNEAIALR